METWRKELYLKHFGIPGMHWGVRRGPPYPIGNGKSHSESKTSTPKAQAGNTGDTERKVNHLIRNVAVAAIIGGAAVGAAYYAKKHDLFSKIPISSLKKPASTAVHTGKIKFSSSPIKIDKNTGGMLFNPLVWQAAVNRYPDRLQNLNKFVYPDGKKSLLDKPNGANDEYLDHGGAIIKAIDDRMRQGVLTLDIVEFARELSGGKINPDIGMPINKQLIMISDNRDIFQKVIDAGEDFGDLKVQQAQELLDIFDDLADIYRNERK